jgi:ribosomal 50S subunit-associated protein YjgA (DUF615 family)
MALRMGAGAKGYNLTLTEHFPPPDGQAQIPEDEEDDRPQQVALKRESTALQDLGRELAELGKERLARVPIDEDLRDAVKDYQRFTSHEAAGVSCSTSAS